MVIFLLHKTQLSSWFLQGFSLSSFSFFSPRKNFYTMVYNRNNYQFTTWEKKTTSGLYSSLFCFLQILTGQPASGSISSRCIRGDWKTEVQTQVVTRIALLEEMSHLGNTPVFSCLWTHEHKKKCLSGISVLATLYFVKEGTSIWCFNCH